MKRLAARYLFQVQALAMGNRGVKLELDLMEQPVRCMSLASERLRFDGQTAIVTGAGRGLGKEYALLLASRGANVVVNDVGVTRSGQQSGDDMGGPPADDGGRCAEQVAQQIGGLGPRAGKALANFESVSSESGARRLAEAALDKFGRIDILINNAGILRDRSFAKMSLEDWDQVCSVHLRGSFLASQACWTQMRRQEYGKIIMTSSTSGLFGNFGQANYAAAKMGLVGLANTLAIEGRRSQIHCNTVVPMAASRMTQDIIPEELARRLNPSYVAPLVVWLCHKDCQESGGLFEAAGQWFGRHQLYRSRGKYLPGICESGGRPLESLADNWQEISSMEQEPKRLESFGDHLNELLLSFERGKVGGGGGDH